MKSKFSSRTSWRAKLERVQEPKVVTIPLKMQPRFGTGKMLIPRPLDVDALIRTVIKGKLVTQGQIRKNLARAHHADVTCPITTGIFCRISAEAAEEERRAGKKNVTPYWRVVRDDGSLIEKFPGGPKSQARLLRAEGHSLTPAKGRKPPKVKELDRHLTSLE
ncbi:MAG: MGMT family protein [Acidobacteria bacterium]|nr:MGMT family protein [Acidobacteriota bacterium]